MQILKITSLAMVALTASSCLDKMPWNKEEKSAMADLENQVEIIEVANIEQEEELFDRLAAAYELTEIAEAPSLALSLIAFNLNESTLSIEANNLLEAHLNYLNNNPEATVTIAGYACPLGSRAFNIQISEKRALAVAQYLIDNGIDSSRITTAAMGSDDLMIDSDITSLDKSEQISALSPERKVLISYN